MHDEDVIRDAVAQAEDSAGRLIYLINISENLTPDEYRMLTQMHARIIREAGEDS